MPVPLSLVIQHQNVGTSSKQTKRFGAPWDLTKKNIFEIPKDPKKWDLGGFIQTRVIASSFIVGCVTYWLVGGGLPQKAPPSVTVTETTKRWFFPYIELTGGLLYLTPKMRTFSSMGVMFHWPCLWKKHWSHNGWLQYCVSSWLIFLFFLHSSILIVVFDPNYWSGSDQKPSHST